MKTDSEIPDEMRPEYDLKSLRVRKVGSGRKKPFPLVERIDETKKQGGLQLTLFKNRSPLIPVTATMKLQIEEVTGL